MSSSISPVTSFATHETDGAAHGVAAARVCARPYRAVLQSRRPPDAHGDLRLPEPRRLRPSLTRRRRPGEERRQQAAPGRVERYRNPAGHGGKHGRSLETATAY